MIPHKKTISSAQDSPYFDNEISKEIQAKNPEQIINNQSE